MLFLRAMGIIGSHQPWNSGILLAHTDVSRLLAGESSLLSRKHGHTRCGRPGPQASCRSHCGPASEPRPTMGPGTPMGFTDIPELGRQGFVEHTVVRGWGSGIRWFGFNPKLIPCLAVCPWTSHSTSPSFSFCLCSLFKTSPPPTP